MKLSDVCTKGTSNIAQKDLDARNGTYPIYGASGFIKNVDFYHQEKPYIAIVKDGAGVGRVMQLPAKSSVIGTMQYIIPNEGVSVEYLAYALEHMNLSKYYLGAAIPHIYFKDYCSETLPNHTPEEQAHISHVLGLVGNLIFLRKQQLAKLNELVKSRFIEMFGDQRTNPFGWDMVTIGDIATEVRYGTSRPAVEGGKYPYLRMNNLTYEGYLDLTDLKYIDIPDNEIEKCVVRKGDVLFNRTNSVELVGKTCVYNLDYDMIIAGYIIRVRIDDRMLPVVLSNYLNSTVLKEQLRSMAKGAVNQANINAQELQSIPIYLPPIDLQHEFAAFVEQIDKSKFYIIQTQKITELLIRAIQYKTKEVLL